MTAFDLKGHVALVTGGNGGIGLGMARGLAEAGASIAIAARNMEKSEAAAETLRAVGAEVITIAVDVSSEQSVTEMVAATLDKFGRVDSLIANAGVATFERQRPDEILNCGPRYWPSRTSGRAKAGVID